MFLTHLLHLVFLVWGGPIRFLSLELLLWGEMSRKMSLVHLALQHRTHFMTGMSILLEEWVIFSESLDYLFLFLRSPNTALPLLHP
jgi:hypothetical protein